MRKSTKKESARNSNIHKNHQEVVLEDIVNRVDEEELRNYEIKRRGRIKTKRTMKRRWKIWWWKEDGDHKKKKKHKKIGRRRKTQK